MNKGYALTGQNFQGYNASTLLWQIGVPRHGVFGAEAAFGFAPIHAPVHHVDVDAAEIRQDLGRFPAMIVANPETSGVGELRLKTTLAPGRYTLLVDILESEKSNFAMVRFDGSEIGSFGISYTGNIDMGGVAAAGQIGYRKNDVKELAAIAERYAIADRYRKQQDNRRVFRFEVPFVCTESGPHILSLLNRDSWLNGQVKTYAGDGFAPVAYTLVQEFPASHSTLVLEIPGRALVPVWGWMSMTSFDHPANRVTPPERLALRSILESFKWGANNFEFLPVNVDGMALEVGSDPWDGREQYMASTDKTWTSEEVRRLVRLAHEHGMLVEFFIYCLFGAAFIKHKMEFRQKVALLEQIARRYSDALGANPNECVDGLIHEAWFPVDGPQYTQAVWDANPEFFLLSSINDGAQYDIINAGYSPAMHHYGAHWPCGLTQQTGYDHSYPLMPYPREFYEKAEGTLYTYMQACGQTGHPRKNFPLRDEQRIGITNRTVSPDWILAQAHSFGLRKLVDPEDNLAMALCWEADEETMAPALARRYIYAASQDPVRLAAAGQLEDTGAGGEIDLKRHTRRIRREDTLRLRERHTFPATTTFIQNRHVQLLLLKDKEHNVLLCDLLGTARFYNHGATVMLGFPFCATRFRDARFLEQHTRIVEAAGVKSVVEEHSRMGSGYVDMQQTARYTVYSDVPAVDVDITRTIQPGLAEDINTVLGLCGYDTVVAEGKTLTDTAGLAPGCLTIRDSTGVMPELFIQVRASDPVRTRLAFSPAQGLCVTQPLAGSHSLRVTVLVKVEAAFDGADQDLRDLLSQRELTAEIGAEGGLDIPNESRRDLVRCVKIPNPDEAPYFVREGGWWVFKGATPSQEYPGCDYVKVYAKAGIPSRIQRYGFIEGVLRPAAGCQNVLAFRDIRVDAAGVSFGVEVSAVNPMIFAPRVQMVKSVQVVQVDGADWRLFDGHEIALPNRRGRYQVRIAWGDPVGPRLVRCGAAVTAARCTDNRFVLELANPEWVRRNSPHTPYSLVVDLGHLDEVAEIQGAELKERHGSRLRLQCAPNPDAERFEVMISLNRKESQNT